jgi:hypothetical protein
MSIQPAAVPLRPHKEAKYWDSPTAFRSRRARRAFVDWKRIRVKAGNGGDGSFSMAHLYAVEFGGKNRISIDCKGEKFDRTLDGAPGAYGGVSET